MSRETYLTKDGKFEVSPEKMTVVGQEDLSEVQIKLIRQFRENFMKRMRLHFARNPET